MAYAFTLIFISHFSGFLINKYVFCQLILSLSWAILNKSIGCNCSQISFHDNKHILGLGNKIVSETSLYIFLRSQDGMLSQVLPENMLLLSFNNITIHVRLQACPYSVHCITENTISVLLICYLPLNVLSGPTVVSVFMTAI